MLKNWELVKAYFRGRNFAQMEIDSYNQFIDKKLKEILEENKEITPKIEEVKLELSDIEVQKPRTTEADGSPRIIYPMEARIRNRTYSAPLFLTMKLLRRDVEQDVKKTYVGEMPVMLKSNRCWLEGKNEEELVEIEEDPKDFGGYFIINGTEKVLMTQEVLASDKVMVSKQAQDRVVAEVISTRGAFKGRVRIVRNPDGILSVTFPASPRKLRLFTLLMALGLKDKNDIVDSFPREQEVQNDVLLNLEQLLVKSNQEALDRIGKYVAPGQVIDYRLRRAQEVIDAFLLPHIGQKEPDRLAKAYYLTMMATKAIERAHGVRGQDDKDHYGNKRLELSGKLMEHLFRYSFKYFVKDLKFQVDRTITRRRKLNISTVVRPGAITERIRFAMSTGNWIGRATGVSKFMDRVNYLAPLTDLRKVKSPLDKNRELYEARDVHGTHFGRLCPIETPDGPNCVSPDTEIILGDYSATTIGEFENLWKNKQVASVEWGKKQEAPSNVGRYLKIKADKAFEVITKETSRRIIATKDHPFYSEKFGKTELEKLGIGDKVVVLPIKPLPFEKPNDETIVSEQDILNACPKKTDREYILRELKEKKLAPLRADNEKLLAITRLVGHVFGDGCLAVSMKKHKSSCDIVCSGREGELKEIAKDIEALGFNATKPKSSKATSILSNGRTIGGTSTRIDCYSKPLWVLLKSLGAPARDKTTKETTIPQWIKTQRKIVAKEFLASYFGSEMTKPAVDKRNGKIFLQPAFSLNKTRELIKNGVDFVEDIRELLEVFGIRSRHIKIVYGTKRKSGAETRKIKAFIASDLDNLVKLYGTIGFKYCNEKESLARLAYAYLLEKKTLIEKRIAIQQRAIALNANGLKVSQIFRELDKNLVKRHDVGNWIKKHGKGLNKFVRVSEKGFPKFNNWVREHCVSENGLVWETIESIKERECPNVRDITTIEDYHNFFANGFLTGNCGLVKNLALLAEVTTDSDEEEVEKALKEMGVKLK